jgi:hypothetical protein
MLNSRGLEECWGMSRDGLGAEAAGMMGQGAGFPLTVMADLDNDFEFVGMAGLDPARGPVASFLLTERGRLTSRSRHEHTRDPRGFEVTSIRFDEIEIETGVRVHRRERSGKEASQRCGHANLSLQARSASEGTAVPSLALRVSWDDRDLPSSSMIGRQPELPIHESFLEQVRETGEE